MLTVPFIDPRGFTWHLGIIIDDTVLMTVLFNEPLGIRQHRHELIGEAVMMTVLFIEPHGFTSVRLNVLFLAVRVIVDAGDIQQDRGGDIGTKTVVNFLDRDGHKHAAPTSVTGAWP